MATLPETVDGKGAEQKAPPGPGGLRPAGLTLLQPVVAGVCSPNQEEKPAAWITGSTDTEAGAVPGISTVLARADFLGHVRCRTSAYRNTYTVRPGVYAVGDPDRSSDVLVSANYKLSFDHLRRELGGLNLWILVIDTRGINVWCAAGKGTFGSDELIRRIALTRLEKIVDHRRLIVPQLAAPGVNGNRVRKATGFSVLFGPVYARDLPAYLRAGRVATPGMRTVRFPLIDRLILTPMEINPSLKKYPWFALLTLVIFGLQPSGIIFRDAWNGGLPFLLLGLVSVFSGALLTPVLLPFIPFRPFALKGWIAGIAATVLCTQTVPMLDPQGTILRLVAYLLFPMASSYIALQFTGSTTFTGMSGVRKELRIAIPVYVLSGVVSLLLLLIYKLGEWRLL
ncbi:MAG: mercury methylation corrinoid protein HgcA [Nitrospiraceae bacterium]|nr:mercury methylation corrinoid protein HgcA [Nitrospiraceae bacterium]